MFLALILLYYIDMTHPLELLTPAELRTELGAAILELDRKQEKIERLRGELSELITALEQHDHWLDTMPTALIKSARAELEQK